MTFRVEFGTEAEKQFESLDGSIRKRIETRIKELANNPLDVRISKQLVNMEGARSSRVGDWRIVYLVKSEIGTILVSAIGPRGSVYRRR